MTSTTIPEEAVFAAAKAITGPLRDPTEWELTQFKLALTAALPHLPGVGVKVKPLDWTDDSAPGYRLFSAQSDIGHFAYGTDADGTPWSSSPLGIKDHANEEAAKRAAEMAHHELVVDQAKAIGLEISALEPSAARELALEEAAHNAAMYLATGFISCPRCGEDVETKNTDAEYTLRAALSSPDHADAGKVEGDEPIACVGEMQTSSGADYYVCVKVGGREITPHMFKERWKAEYEVAEWLWLFNGGEKPDLLAYGPLPSAPSQEVAGS